MEDFKITPVVSESNIETKEKHEFAIEEIRQLLKVIDGKERLDLAVEERIENIKGELISVVFTCGEKETKEGDESTITYLLTLVGQRYKSDGTLGRMVSKTFLTKDYDGGLYSDELADYVDGEWTNFSKMEEFPKPENSQEKIEKGKVLEMLRANGLEHPETKEMVMKWTEQQEALVEKENTSRAGIIFNIERTDLYLTVGDMSGALENLEDARMQAHQENDIELYEKIMKKMDEIEARSVEVGEGVGEAEIQVQEKQTEESATRRQEELTQAKELLTEIKFEGQFAHKEKFLINGATVESVDIKPENPKTEIPVLIAPGFAATMDSFKPGMKVLMESDRRVISLDHPRRGGTIPDSFDEEIEKNPSEELRKAHTILGLLEQKNIEKTDVVAHSEAAINVCIAAMLHSEKFRNIVLYSPAGLIGNDTLFRLIKGAMANTSRTETMSTIPVTEAEAEYLAATAKIGPDYQKANPLRAAKEVLAISQAQIEDMLRYLREKGIKVVVVAAVDDTMFPMDKYQKNVDTSFVDGFLSVRGGHMQIQVHPELYMGAAESMLTALEEKEKKESISEM